VGKTACIQAIHHSSCPQEGYLNVTQLMVAVRYVSMYASRTRTRESQAVFGQIRTLELRNSARFVQKSFSDWMQLTR
jgi:hypothetical protein